MKHPLFHSNHQRKRNDMEKLLDIIAHIKQELGRVNIIKVTVPSSCFISLINIYENASVDERIQLGLNKDSQHRLHILGVLIDSSFKTSTVIFHEEQEYEYGTDVINSAKFNGNKSKINKSGNNGGIENIVNSKRILN